MKRIAFLVLPLLIFQCLSRAQDLAFVKDCIDSLASPRFQGRGYVNNGDKIAAAFLARQLKNMDVRYRGSGYFQEFSLAINTFPGTIGLWTDGNMLQPGKDYLVSLSSPSVSGTYKTLWLNGKSLSSEAAKRKFKKKDLKNYVLILDTGFKDMKEPLVYRAKAIIRTTAAALTWDAADGTELAPCALIDVSRARIPAGCKKIRLEIESEFQKDYKTQNVIGYIPGSTSPDSFFVFIGHYDHLGRMGADTYFPGAHDNASGCAMMLDLARYYSQAENRQKYSIAFIFLSAEEAGLLGSAYYTGHPLFPLSSIKFLINLDMESTGSEGIKVVNGSVYKEQFDLLVKLNEEGRYLKTISPRGEAANSDHYWFWKKGVKCFYFYTLGNEWKEYHTPADVAAGLPMTKYNELFRLVTAYIKALSDK